MHLDRLSVLLLGILLASPSPAHALPRRSKGTPRVARVEPRAPGLAAPAPRDAIQDRADNALQMPLVWCPPGTFVMGLPPAEDLLRDSNQVQVALTRGFWLGKYEVTQAEWKAVMGTIPWRDGEFAKEGDRHPAIYLTWRECVEFCTKLTESERLARRLPADWEYRLPTEAQWEYACRAGTATRFSFGDKEADLAKYAWHSGHQTDAPFPHEVGLKLANPWGFYDIHGNVWEWCLDAYREKLPGGSNPSVPGKDDPEEDRTLRGGGWSGFPHDCLCGARDTNQAKFRFACLGFRVARVYVGKQ